MAMTVTVEISIPNVAPSVATLTRIHGPEWGVIGHMLTRTCPVSGNVHSIPIEIEYICNNTIGGWALDTLFVVLGNEELGIASYGPARFTSVTSDLAVSETGTQTRTMSVTLPPVIDVGQTGADGVTTPNRLQGGVFTVNALDIPIPILRGVQLKNAFHYILAAGNASVEVYEDAGGGVAGALYGSVTTDAAGECSLSVEMPLRDFVLRTGGEDYPLAAGSAVAEITTDSIDKTDVVAGLLLEHGDLA